MLKHNHNEDTPFRYNFETRYPPKCEFYCTCTSPLSLLAEPIKNEEFELLIQYQPCLYASDFLCHGTSRGLLWVEYVTRMFSEGVYPNMKNMEIFGIPIIGAIMARQRFVQGRHGQLPRDADSRALPRAGVVGHEL